MFEQKDFFIDAEEQAHTQLSGLGEFGRKAGQWLGFFTVLSVLMFTAVHGINATLEYQANGLMGKVFGIVGIISNEAILFALILKWHNRGITGNTQRVLAGITFVIGILLIALVVIADSRLNANLPLGSELAFFFGYILPISPLIMSVLFHIVDETSPEQLWSHQQANAERQVLETQFKAHIIGQLAEVETRKSIANALLNARQTAANTVAAYFQSEAVQQTIRDNALANVPALLQAIGIDSHVLGLTDNGDTLPTEVPTTLKSQQQPQRPLPQTVHAQTGSAPSLTHHPSHSNGTPTATTVKTATKIATQTVTQTGSYLTLEPIADSDDTRVITAGTLDQCRLTMGIGRFIVYAQPDAQGETRYKAIEGDMPARWQNGRFLA